MNAFQRLPTPKLRHPIRQLPRAFRVERDAGDSAGRTYIFREHSGQFDRENFRFSAAWPSEDDEIAG